MSLMMKLGKMAVHNAFQSELVQKTLTLAESKGQTLLKSLFNPQSVGMTPNPVTSDESLSCQLKTLQALAAEIRVDLKDVQQTLNVSLSKQVKTRQ